MDDSAEGTDSSGDEEAVVGQQSAENDGQNQTLQGAEVIFLLHHALDEQEHEEDEGACGEQGGGGNDGVEQGAIEDGEPLFVPGVAEVGGQFEAVLEDGAGSGDGEVRGDCLRLSLP